MKVNTLELLNEMIDKAVIVDITDSPIKEGEKVVATCTEDEQKIWCAYETYERRGVVYFKMMQDTMPISKLLAIIKMEGDPPTPEAIVLSEMKLLHELLGELFWAEVKRNHNLMGYPGIAVRDGYTLVILPPKTASSGMADLLKEILAGLGA